MSGRMHVRSNEIVSSGHDGRWAARGLPERLCSVVQARRSAASVVAVVAVALVTACSGGDDTSPAPPMSSVTSMAPSSVAPTSTSSTLSSTRKSPTRPPAISPPSKLPPAAPPRPPVTEPRVSATSGEPLTPGIEYSSCAHAREAGAAPLYSGDIGYSPALDPDGDGVACDE